MEKVNAPDPIECSMIAEVAVSIVRDRAISSLYGYKASMAGRFDAPDDVFCGDYARRVEAKVSNYVAEPNLFPLYSGHGELLGQLARLFIVCNEKTNLKEAYSSRANERLASIGLEIVSMEGDNILRHLRNSVMHCRYAIQPSKGSFEDARLVFIDRRGEKETARIVMGPEQLEQAMDILLEEVCFRYLADSNWVI